MSIGTTSLALATIYVCSMIAHTTSLTLTASPEPFHIRDPLTISCRFERFDRVVSIVIGKENQKDIATINNEDGLLTSADDQNNTKAEGHIGKTSTHPSYLTVTIKRPTIGDAGTYFCRVFFLNGEGTLKEVTKNIYTTFNEFITCSFYKTTGPALFQEGDIITYQNLDNGCGYDKNTGKFIAPYEGVYTLKLMAISMLGEDAIISLKVNGRDTASVHLRSDDRMDNAILIHNLQVGDSVYPSLSSLNGTDTLKLISVFSGRLHYK